MARARKGWGELSTPYKNRLIRAGVTAKTYKTADLRSARGHSYKAPRSAAPKTVFNKIEAGELLGNADLKALSRWRSSSAYPAWLKESSADLDDRTAAVLSTHASPKTWKIAHFGYYSSGEVLLTVTPKNGYQWSIVLPSQESAAQVQALLRRGKYKGLIIPRHESLGAQPVPAPVKKPVKKAAKPKKKPAIKAKKPVKKPAKKVAKKKTRKKA